MNTKKKSTKADLEHKRPGFFVVGLIVATGLTLVAFEWRTPVDDFRPAEPGIDVIDWGGDPAIVIPIPEPPEHQVQKKQQGPPQANKQVFTFTVRKQVDDSDDLDDLDFGDFDEPDTGEPPVKYIPTPPVLTTAEQMPQFPGGELARMDFMRRTVRFPRDVMATAQSGKVYVQFVVWTDGSIRDVEILSSSHPSLTKEVLRMVDVMPNWISGMQGGQKVPVRLVVPVNFEQS